MWFGKTQEKLARFSGNFFKSRLAKLVTKKQLKKSIYSCFAIEIASGLLTILFLQKQVLEILIFEVVLIVGHIF